MTWCFWHKGLHVHSLWFFQCEDCGVGGRDHVNSIDAIPLDVPAAELHCLRFVMGATRHQPDCTCSVLLCRRSCAGYVVAPIEKTFRMATNVVWDYTGDSLFEHQQEAHVDQ